MCAGEMFFFNMNFALHSAQCTLSDIPTLYEKIGNVIGGLVGFHTVYTHDIDLNKIATILPCI